MFFLPLCLCSFFCSVVRSFTHGSLMCSAVRKKCSPDIFFRVIHALRCPSYFQYKEGALKQALKERSSTHGSLMCSAVRKKRLPMRRDARATMGTSALHCGERFESMAPQWRGFESSKRHDGSLRPTKALPL